MKKKIYTLLAIAALGMISSTTLAIGLNNKVNDYHEAHADEFPPAHTHDTELTESLFNFGSVPAGTHNYYLASDLTIQNSTSQNKYVTVGDGATINLCLNGHTIKTSSGIPSTADGLFNIAGGTVNVYDCGTDEHSYTIDSNKRAVIDSTFDSSHEKFTGGSFYQFFNYPIFRLTSSGTVNWYGGNIIGSGNNYCDSTILLYGSSYLNIYSGSFIGNLSGYDFIEVSDGSEAHIGLDKTGSNVLFHKNTIPNGIIHGSTNSDLFVNHATFSNNTGYNGAILARCNFTCENTVFRNNHCNGNGGAVKILRESYTSASAGIDFDTVTFEANEATGNGGALSIETNHTAIDNNYFEFQNCSFVNNVAGMVGGAINISDRSKSYSNAYFYNCLLANNSATNSELGMGGAIFYEGCTVYSGSDLKALLLI